mgnify:CR=1 FL=1
MFEKLSFIESRHDELSVKISDPAVIADQDTWRKLCKEHSDITPIVDKYREYKAAKETIEEANLLLETETDKEFKEMLQEQGLKVDTIEVTVGNFEFDRNGQAGDSNQEDKKNGSRGFMTDEEIGQKDDTDELAKVFMEGGESTVNYMA